MEDNTVSISSRETYGDSSIKPVKVGAFRKLFEDSKCKMGDMVYAERASDVDKSLSGQLLEAHTIEKWGISYTCGDIYLITGVTYMCS